MNISPNKYITLKKIEKSITILTETNLHTSHIASELGFKSLSNFNYIFKKVTGKTPNHFRKWNLLNKKKMKSVLK